jgi:hypothetical protein
VAISQQYASTGQQKHGRMPTKSNIGQAAASHASQSEVAPSPILGTVKHVKRVEVLARNADFTESPDMFVNTPASAAEHAEPADPTMNPIFMEKRRLEEVFADTPPSLEELLYDEEAHQAVMERYKDNLEDLRRLLDARFRLVLSKASKQLFCLPEIVMGQTDRRRDRWRGQADRTDRQMKRQTDIHTDEQMDRGANGC